MTGAELERFLWRRIESVNERLEDHEKIRKIALLRTDFPEMARNVTAFW